MPSSNLEKELRQRRIDYIVIHCAATRNGSGYTALQCHKDHVNKGWSRIGYHLFIEEDGTVVRGRDIDEVGAHVQGHNENSVGICLSGGVDSNGVPDPEYTPDQWESLGITVDFLMRMYPNAEVLGHRDFPNVNKACPCFDVEAWVLTR